MNLLQNLKKTGLNRTKMDDKGNVKDPIYDENAIMAELMIAERVAETISEKNEIENLMKALKSIHRYFN